MGDEVWKVAVYPFALDRAFALLNINAYQSHDYRLLWELRNERHPKRMAFRCELAGVSAPPELVITDHNRFGLFLNQMYEAEKRKRRVHFDEARAKQEINRGVEAPPRLLEPNIFELFRKKETYGAPADAIPFWLKE